MKTKLNIADLSVKSFITTLDKPVEETVKGGFRTRRDDVTDCCTFHPRRCG
ncbi:MAG: pinensin family lanthipeptide [Bacteroidota bacterium]